MRCLWLARSRRSRSVLAHAGVGEIYHLVIDRKHTGQGQATLAITACIDALRAADPALRAVRVSHHAENAAAARLYARFGFVEIGVKIDGETGIHDRLLEYSCPPRGCGEQELLAEDEDLRWVRR